MVNEKTDMCILIGTLDSIYVYENTHYILETCVHFYSFVSVNYEFKLKDCHTN